jgi:hypothetical protein
MAAGTCGQGVFPFGSWHKGALWVAGSCQGGGRQARLFNFSRGDGDSSRFHHQAKTARKTLDLNCFVTSLWLFICEE